MTVLKSRVVRGEPSSRGGWAVTHPIVACATDLSGLLKGVADDQSDVHVDC